MSSEWRCAHPVWRLGGWLPLALGFFLSVACSVPGNAEQGQGTGLSIVTGMESVSLAAGEWVTFTTLLRNDGAQPTPPLVAHLSIAGMDDRQHVDPEDWSPRRTQSLSPLQPGETLQLEWRLHALFAGEFASFVTLIPKDASFKAISGAPLRLNVEPKTILPLAAVVPVAVLVPLIPLGLLGCSVARSRRRPGIKGSR